MLRKIIEINEELCDGCEKCISACSEGAIKLINGKAKLVKENYCDGFGDCLGECPTGALKIVEKDTQPFDIVATKEYLLKTGGYDAVLNLEEATKRHTFINQDVHSGCPGTKSVSLNRSEPGKKQDAIIDSKLTNWPIQIHLIPIQAIYYNNADILLAADCCSYSYSNFHDEFMKNHVTIIGCPKLDQVELYQQKLTDIFCQNDIHSLTITYMEVPCCMGIVQLGYNAVNNSKKKIPIEIKKLSIHGQVIQQNNYF